MKTAEQRRRERPFLCRVHLWHRWQLRFVKLFEGRTVGLWVCKRCHMAYSMRPFANGGIIPKGSERAIVGADEGPPDLVVPLRQPNAATVRWMAAQARRKS